MPRPLRLHVPGATHHVTLRGNHRQNIFFRNQDRELLDEIVAEVIARFNARLHAYCYMTNHVHLLLQVDTAPLGRLMVRIAGRYARAVQKTLRTTGHLFERRYHSVLVDADAYLLELLRYVHFNPVRARMVASPDDYPWSSHHAYLGRRSETWVTTDFALSMFHSEHARAIAAYRRFINEGVGREALSPFVELNPNDQRVLGNDAFAAKMLGDAWRPRSCKTLEQIIAEACELFEVQAELLDTPSRAARLVQVRAWVAHQAVTLRVASIAAVARRFNRDESSLRHGLMRYAVEAPQK